MVKQGHGERFRTAYMRRFVSALRGIDRSRGLGRARAIKFAADVSLAMSEASSGTAWSRNILAHSRKKSPNFMDFIRNSTPRSCGGCNQKVGWSSGEWGRNFISTRSSFCILRRMRRSLCKSSYTGRLISVSCKRRVKRLFGGYLKKKIGEKKIDGKIKVLKSLVPGGAAMDTPLLLQEALQYISALQVQIIAVDGSSHDLFSISPFPYAYGKKRKRLSSLLLIIKRRYLNLTRQRKFQDR